MAGEIRKPLLASNGPKQPDEFEDDSLDESLKGVPTTGFGKASFLNRILFLWLNPLLEVGFGKPLVKDDVPLLMREHRAKKLYSEFNANWPKHPKNNALWATLFRTFWRQFVLTTSVPAVVKLSVMFIGPLMIGSFSTVTAGEEAFAYEGYVLVLILFMARAMEIGSSHFYYFNCSRLGIQTRTALVGAVYRKGLRLSSSARQEHGVGQIVNYMSTDVQQISDSLMQLNNIWLVPCQVAMAIFILFYISGASAAAGTLFMACSTIVTIWIAQKLQRSQREIMAGRDARMRVTVEAITSMKIIKLQAWDTKFLDMVARARQSEFASLTRYLLWQAATTTSFWVTPLLSTVAIFAAEYYTGRNMTTSAAFTTIATVKIVQEPLRLMPNTIVFVSQAYISLQRLDKYLRSDELDENAVVSLPAGGPGSAISVKEGTFTWSRAGQDQPSVQDLDLEVTPGSFVAIVGKVGTGKSSLLSALLGEMPKVSGTVKLCGSKAYVSQQAWIQSGTIQDNILFGKPMDRARYESVLDCCSLRDDLGQFDGGDQTEIGERGLNLSGGQKQRIQLARAVYQECDVYLLDDIFSAVDAHTASDIFRDCIMGVLARKTVLLVTHQIDFLHGADLILVMRGGKIVQKGKYEDLLMGGSDFQTLVEATNKAISRVSEQELDESVQKESHAEGFERRLSSSFRPESGELPVFDTGEDDQTKLYRRHSSKSLLSRSYSKTKRTPAGGEESSPADDTSGQLVREEEREIGRVSPMIYWQYLTRVYKGTLFLLVFVIQVAWQGFQISSDFWVSDATPAEGEIDASKMGHFVRVYGILVLSCAGCFLIRMFTITIICLQTSQSFYMGMLKNLFRAPMSFFDTTPTGRILSRSSLDQAQVDIFISLWLAGVLAFAFQLAGVFLVTMRIIWELVFLLIPLGYFYYQYQRYYFASARELTRVDAITKAPVIHHFEESVAGLATIRGFQEQPRFIQTNVDRIDSNVRMEFHVQASTEWVGFRMEMLGVWILCGSALLLVVLPASWIDKDLAGLCLTYGLNLNISLFLVAWTYCQLENRMVSVERIGQYSKLPPEAALSIDETRPPQSWPDVGGICLQNLKLRYRPNTPLILKGVSLKIEGGQKVGVVGRTGSGKSTLILALFRLVEADAGRILIDHVDISTLGLNDLRSRLGIIPQDPTLFDGTIRNNLDPLEEYADSEIWEVLKKCQLHEVVRQLPGQLDSLVLENGENFSVGQRQLFCLGRALLKRSRILVLDEATASVDAETDAVMQNTIREEFRTSTVISVAHRIPTVMDYDKVLVLDAGKVKEFDSPQYLVNDQASLFAALVREYTNRTSSYGDLKFLGENGNVE